MKTVISVKVDKDIRDKARKTAHKLRVPLSMVVNESLRRFSEEQRIEFVAPVVPNAKTAKVLQEAERDWQEGRMHKFSPLLRTAAEMDRYLDKLKK